MLILRAEDRRQETEEWRVSTLASHQVAVERVIQTMREQLREPLSLEDMADIACLSPYYFCRVFRQLVGLPPGEFLASLRLDAAKRLLLTTQLSVTDVCFEVGYVGLGSFTTRFTQLVGVPPRLLRTLAGRSVMLSPAPLADDPAPVLAPSDGVSGHIHTLSAFRGVIFAGLFPKPLPQARPVRCTRLMEPGPYHIPAVPDGRYYLMVAAFPASEDPRMYLFAENAPLVGMHGPLVVRNGSAREPVDIVLRPLRLTDPPIIAALPFL
jgi:AraC family transcriptional regulator